MHAVIISVSVAPGHLEAARKALREQVVPRVKGASGFVKGIWTGNDDSGLSMTLFKTQQDAEAGAAMARNAPPPPGVTLKSVDVREVIVEA